MLKVSVPRSATTEQLLLVIRQQVAANPGSKLMVCLPERPAVPNKLILDDVLKELDGQGIKHRFEGRDMIVDL